MITPNIYSLELDITYACGFGCVNCNRMTVVAPGTKEQNVTPEQIGKLLVQSIEIGHKWTNFSVLGGEPTVHPQFREIMDLLAEYKEKVNPDVYIQVVTHGSGTRVHEQVKWLEQTHPNIRIRNTRKKSIRHSYFVSVNLAPKDRLPEDNQQGGKIYHGCRIASKCGIGFNYSGLYCCAIAGAIDRVFNLGLAIKELRELTPGKLMATYNAFCSKCGHYADNDVKLIKDNTETQTSPTWRIALKQYHETGSDLRRY